MKLILSKKSKQGSRRRNRPPAPQPMKESRTNPPRRVSASGDTRISSDRDNRHAGAAISKTQHLRRRLSLMLMIVFIVGLLGFTSFIDVHNPHVRIITTDQSESAIAAQADILRENEYTEATAAALGESLRSRSKLTINKTDIESAVTTQFPEVQLASLQFHLVDRTPIMRLVPRRPVLLVESFQDKTRFYVDPSGVVIARESPDASDDISIRTVVDESGIELIPGNRVLPVDTIRFIDQVEKQFAAADLRIQAMSLPAVANELHVRVVGDDYVGKFDITSDVRIQAGAFIAVRQRLTQDNTQPNEYIDARIQGRAYYR